MNGLDAMFLAAETPTMPLHVTAALVLEAPAASRSSRRTGATGRPWFTDTLGDPPPFVVLRELVERRIAAVPVLRRRALPVPFGLDHPVWVDDPDFRLDEHLRRVRLPVPGGQRELAALVADLAARPLDRQRPLWELVLAEGLDSGHQMVVAKLHHAVADGLLGTEIIAAFLDGTADPDPGGPLSDEWVGERLPREHDLLFGAASALMREPETVADTLLRSTATVRALVRHNRRLREEEGRRPPPPPFSAPLSSISGPLSSQRAFAFTQVPMDDVTAVRRAFGGTVNDVVLSVVGGALRQLLADRGEPLGESLVAMVPRSVRDDGPDAGALDPEAGNRLSAMLVSLGTSVSDPVVRLRLVAEGTRLAKAQARLIPDALVQGWARLAVPAWTARAARLVSNLRVFERARPVFNVLVSNVQGPASSLWLAGNRLVAVYPSGPVAEGAGVNVTAISYNGTLFLGVTTCRRLVPEAWALADHLTDGFGTLTKAADRSGNWCP